jgi:putative nucleotidyltransferase with HDIG domain
MKDLPSLGNGNYFIIEEEKENYFLVEKELFRKGDCIDFPLYLKDKTGINQVFDFCDICIVEKNVSWFHDEIVIRISNLPLYEEFIKGKKEKYPHLIAKEHLRLAIRRMFFNYECFNYLDSLQITTKEMVDIILNDTAAFSHLLSRNKFDYCTYNHCVEVAIFSVFIAISVGIDNPDELSDICLGGVLHDLGKIFIQQSILNKPGKVTNEEFQEIKKHTTYGEVLLSSYGLPNKIVKFAFEHHERIDGNGYPNNLCKEELFVNSRIIAIADVFDALTTHRPYRNNLSVTESLEIMNIDRGHFDSCLFKSFIKHLFEVISVQNKLKENELLCCDN